MASATRTPVPVPPPTEVVLTLSETEAQVLFRVLSAVGGSPVTTPRRYIDNIYDALESVNVLDVEFEFETKYHRLMFADQS